MSNGANAPPPRRIGHLSQHAQRPKRSKDEAWSAVNSWPRTAEIPDQAAITPCPGGCITRKLARGERSGARNDPQSLWLGNLGDPRDPRGGNFLVHWAALWTARVQNLRPRIYLHEAGGYRPDSRLPKAMTRAVPELQAHCA